MKIVITNMQDTGKVTYYPIDEKNSIGDENLNNRFIYELRDAIKKGKIYELKFLDERLLKIEYLSQDEETKIETCSCLLDESIDLNSKVVQELRDIVKYFNSVRTKIRNSIDSQISDINKARALLRRFIEAGCVLDSDSTMEARSVLSTMVTKKDVILKDLRLPMSIEWTLKKFIYASLTTGSVLYYLGGFAMQFLDIYGFFSSLFNLSFLPLLIGIFGPAIVGGISASKLSQIEEKWNEKVLNCFVAEYDKKHDIFLNGNNNLALPSMEAKDPFIRFILSDIEYIKTLNIEDYSMELNSLKDLVKRYCEAKKQEMHIGETVDIESFMTELTDLELAMFSKNKRIGLIRRPTEVVREAFIEERLKYIGVEDTPEANDSYLKFIFEQVKRIANYPYEGCEVDLVELYKIATDYVKSKKGEEGLSLSTPGGTLLKRETALELEINKKIKNCEEAEALADDIELLESVIGEAQAAIQNKNEESAPTHIILPKE